MKAHRQFCLSSICKQTHRNDQDMNWFFLFYYHLSVTFFLFLILGKTNTSLIAFEIIKNLYWQYRDFINTLKLAHLLWSRTSYSAIEDVFWLIWATFPNTFDFVVHIIPRSMKDVIKDLIKLLLFHTLSDFSDVMSLLISLKMCLCNSASQGQVNSLEHQRLH